ncbi:DUF805 domain-containing protein [Parasphingopyxis sp. CP4]|uniref:DUF805 domain-containing protein n=1 Tax=Parasphingopyxis sp. CP4 TaxID=2724527 RepID=UPI0015A0E5A2|nr:DUF805 domain-containing protein [Parasphingopyxis sp. CP4]QLC21712.1 DUF805 domain-containing protein [Parasphingopyxis sp. CP4]
MEFMLMPLRRYAEFSGRSRRMEYWMWAVFQFLISIVIQILIFAVGGGAMMATGGDPTAAMAAGGAIMVIFGLAIIISLAFIIPSIAVSVRRLHDTNRSGWWLLAPLAGYVLVFLGAGMESGAITMIGMLIAIGFAITLIVFYFLDGTPGPNRYGEDPKGRGTADTFA